MTSRKQTNKDTKIKGDIEVPRFLFHQVFDGTLWHAVSLADGPPKWYFLYGIKYYLCKSVIAQWGTCKCIVIYTYWMEEVLCYVDWQQG